MRKPELNFKTGIDGSTTRTSLRANDVVYSTDDYPFPLLGVGIPERCTIGGCSPSGYIGTVIYKLGVFISRLSVVGPVIGPDFAVALP